MKPTQVGLNSAAFAGVFGLLSDEISDGSTGVG
jgi:hypothetical protein